MNMFGLPCPRFHIGNRWASGGGRAAFVVFEAGHAGPRGSGEQMSSFFSGGGSCFWWHVADWSCPPEMSVF